MLCFSPGLCSPVCWLGFGLQQRSEPSACVLLQACLSASSPITRHIQLLRKGPAGRTDPASMPQRPYMLPCPASTETVPAYTVASPEITPPLGFRKVSQPSPALRAKRNNLSSCPKKHCAYFTLLLWPQSLLFPHWTVILKGQVGDFVHLCMYRVSALGPWPVLSSLIYELVGRSSRLTLVCRESKGPWSQECPSMGPESLQPCPGSAVWFL